MCVIITRGDPLVSVNNRLSNNEAPKARFMVATQQSIFKVVVGYLCLLQIVTEGRLITVQARDSHLETYAANVSQRFWSPFVTSRRERRPTVRPQWPRSLSRNRLQATGLVARRREIGLPVRSQPFFRH